MVVVIDKLIDGVIHVLVLKRQADDTSYPPWLTGAYHRILKLEVGGGAKRPSSPTPCSMQEYKPKDIC